MSCQPPQTARPAAASNFNNLALNQQCDGWCRLSAAIDTPKNPSVHKHNLYWPTFAMKDSLSPANSRLMRRRCGRQFAQGCRPPPYPTNTAHSKAGVGYILWVDLIVIVPAEQMYQRKNNNLGAGKFWDVGLKWIMIRRIKCWIKFDLMHCFIRFNKL